MSGHDGCVAAPEKPRCPGSYRGHAPSGLERFDGRIGQFERPVSGAGVYRRFIAASERGQQFVYVPVESPVELAVTVVEVSSLPYLRRLVAAGLEHVPSYAVLYEHATCRAVDLQGVRPAVSV